MPLDYPRSFVVANSMFAQNALQSSNRLLRILQGQAPASVIADVVEALRDQRDGGAMLE
jgi:hypothetical protein